jgi:hypothetical protein
MIVVGNNTVASQMHKFQTGKRTGQRRGSHSHPSTSGRYRYQIGESDGSDRQFGAGHRLTPRLVPLRFVLPKARKRHRPFLPWRVPDFVTVRVGTNQLAPYMDNTWLPACGPAAARGPITATRMAPVRPLVGTRTVHVFSSIRRHKFSELWRIRTCDFDSN